MKYKYRLIIEDTKEHQEILEMAGQGTTKSQETCLKSIQREINSTIRKMLTNSEEKD